jgi:hypothetical protein
VLSEYTLRCNAARNARPGDVWEHIKTGKRLTVLRSGPFRLNIRHESGRETWKQHHYLAGDYRPASNEEAQR